MWSVILTPIWNLSHFEFFFVEKRDLFKAIIFYKSYFWKPTWKSHFLFDKSGILSGFLRMHTGVYTRYSLVLPKKWGLTNQFRIMMKIESMGKKCLLAFWQIIGVVEWSVVKRIFNLLNLDSLKRRPTTKKTRVKCDKFSADNWHFVVSILQL